MTSQIFFALADTQRQEILLRLVRGGPQTTLSLLEGVGTTRQGASKHLAVLEQCGLVRARKLGREVIREYNPDAILEAQQWFDDLNSAWDARMDRLSQQYAAEEKDK